MIYGLVGALAIFAPMTYLLVYNLKNQKHIDYLQEQIGILKANLSKQNDEIIFLRNNSEAKVAYNILKDNCRKMGTCHLFK